MQSALALIAIDAHKLHVGIWRDQVGKLADLEFKEPS
jgi:hypothetical protein